MLYLIEPGEIKPQDRLKLLLLSGRVLTVDHFLNTTDASLLFEPLLQAQKIAESAEDQQSLAEALSLLGQANYFTTLIARIGKGLSPNSPQEEGEYQTALTYQQQALELRTTLQDTRGLAESYFYIGVVYERWQQRDQAMQQYTKALEIAHQAGHLFEQSEPARHMAGIALLKGDTATALSYALQSLELREAANFRPHLPFDHLLLSTIYYAKEEKEQALHHAEIASTLAKALNSDKAIAMTDQHLQRFVQD